MNKLTWTSLNINDNQEELTATTIAKFSASAFAKNHLPLAINYKIVVSTELDIPHYTLQISSAYYSFQIDEYNDLDLAIKAAEEYHHQFTAQLIDQNTDFANYPILLAKLLNLDLSLIAKSLVKD